MDFRKRAVEALAGAVLLASVGCTNIHVYPSEDSYQAAAESRAGKYRKVVIPAGGVLDGAVHLLADERGRLYITPEELRKYAVSENFAGGLAGSPLGWTEKKAESALTPGKGIEVPGTPLGPGEVSRGVPLGPEKKYFKTHLPLDPLFNIPYTLGSELGVYIWVDDEGRLYLPPEELKKYKTSEDAEQGTPPSLASGVGGLPTKPGEISGGLPTGPEKKYFRVWLPKDDSSAGPPPSMGEGAIRLWVDEEGRVVVPPEILKQYGIEPKSGSGSKAKLPE